ncbi:MAG: phosphopantetheine-binding protein, partial [Daejeonella sp.]|nr:phosphopantetheine-binding protein [Daejeonella sp.]
MNKKAFHSGVSLKNVEIRDSRNEVKIMGLDSVELLMDWEDFFDIQIPYQEAYRLSTVQKVVEYISTNINYTNRRVDIKQIVLNDLYEALFPFRNADLTFSGSERIFGIIPMHAKT